MSTAAMLRMRERGGGGGGSVAAAADKVSKTVTSSGTKVIGDGIKRSTGKENPRSSSRVRGSSQQPTIIRPIPRIEKRSETAEVGIRRPSSVPRGRSSSPFLSSSSIKVVAELGKNRESRVSGIRGEKDDSSNGGRVSIGFRSSERVYRSKSCRRLAASHLHDMFIVKVTLLVKVTKTFTLKVRASERIEDVKQVIKLKENSIPAHMQELIISGKRLKDGNKISDYITAGNSAVNVVSCESYMKINVKRRSDAGIISHGYKVKRSDSIKTIKSMIDAKEGTISDDYQLVSCGELLENDMTIEASNLINDSVLYMVLVPRDSLLLQIVMPCGRIEKLTVKPLNTIFDLKVALQKNIEMPIDIWQLAYSDVPIEDHVTVANLGLGADSLVHVMLPSVQIFVRICSGKQITVFIKLTDDVASLKKNVFEKAGYPVENQNLIFSGRVLDEGRRIISCGIQKDSTVHLSLVNRM